MSEDIFEMLDLISDGLLAKGSNGIPREIRAYYDLRDGCHIPRKMKKKILGKKMGSSKLNQLLKSVKIGEPIETMFETRDIYPYEFCPKCGCKESYGSGNLTEYPEHWEKFYCLRCKNIVGYIDNSPFIHALECADSNYNPVF